MRHFLLIALLIAAPVWSQQYPSKLVRLVTGRGWELQELHQVGMSLEEVFIRVVAGEQVAPDAVVLEEEAR